MNSYLPPTADEGFRSGPSVLPRFEAEGSEADKQVSGLSQLLWGINWREHLPIAADEGIVVEVADVGAAETFARENFGAIFGDTLAQRRGSATNEQTRTRHKFLRHACDVFVFRDGEVPVGLFVGNPVDWSTYYIRSLSFLEPYQGRTLHGPLLQLLFDILGSRGVQRVEAETAPTNAPCISSLLKHRFVASGTVLSERWGALCRFTRHLSEVQEWEFLDRFSHSAESHKCRYRGHDS